MSDEIKRLIHARANVAELWQVAVAQGMTTLVQDGSAKSFNWLDGLWPGKSGRDTLKSLM